MAPRVRVHKHDMLLLWATVVAAVTVVAAARATTVDECGGGVTFSAAQATDCLFSAAIDTNTDGRIVRTELDVAKSAYMRWWERAAASLAGKGDTRTIIGECDADADGVVTRADLATTRDTTCLPVHDANGRRTERLCHLKTLCDRAAAATGHSTYTT